MVTLGPNTTIGICRQAVQAVLPFSPKDNISHFSTVELCIASTEVLLDSTVPPKIVNKRIK